MSLGNTATTNVAMTQIAKCMPYMAKFGGVKYCNWANPNQLEKYNIGE